MTTGERIRMRRKELGITADFLAEKVGVSRSTVFRYENGNIEKLPMDYLQPIADVLNTTVAYLMGWSESNDLSWEDEFRCKIIEHLDVSSAADLEAAGVSENEVLAIVEGRKHLSLENACNLADQFGLSIDHLVGREKLVVETEKSTTVSGGGLSDKKRALISSIINLDDSDIDVIAAAAEVLIAQRGK